MRSKKQHDIYIEAKRELEACLKELNRDAELFDLNGAEYVSDFRDPVVVNGERYHTHALLVHVKA